MHKEDLTERFGDAAVRGAAVLFVGAGLSRPAGFDDWDTLLEDARAEAGIPEGITDLPLVAEYFVQNVPGGREHLNEYVRRKLVSVDAEPQISHRLLARLPISDIWTTNYDNLLEQVMDDADVVYSNDDLRLGHVDRSRRIFKMHGSLSRSGESWKSAPVLTRSDYDTYPESAPHLFTALQSAYLTRLILFLGFSFDDPNIEVLLRLSRKFGAVPGVPSHLTIMKPPEAANDRRKFELRVRDLRKSGIDVLEVPEYEEIEDVLNRLVRRTRDPDLYVGGSDKSDRSASADRGVFNQTVQSVGSQLADVGGLRVVSLAGPAAMQVCYAMGHVLRTEGRYQPARLRYFFRQADREPVSLDERLGSAVYSELSEEADLRERVIRDCRAALFVGGGRRTEEEIRFAIGEGLPVVPIACVLGAAHDFWQSANPAQSLNRDELSEAQVRDWESLGEPHDVLQVARAAKRLVAAGMYLEPP